MSSSKQISVRMPVDILKRLETKGKTASYIVQAVREKILRDEQSEIEASLACLADDADANDVSDFANAQAKVMARDS